MKKRILVICVIIFTVILCGFAFAEGQTNPRRRHVQDTIYLRDRRQGLYLAGGPSLTILCDQNPALGTPGKFTVQINNDDGSDWVFEYGISDEERDPYGYIYMGNPVASNTFEGFEFYTPGTYQLYVFLYRAGNVNTPVASTWYYFTVEEKTGFPTLEEKALEIVNECRAGTAWQTALNLHDWLTNNTYYDRNYEYYGADVLFRGKGVCDSYSKAFKLLCNTAGITVERVISNAQNHAWNVIQLDGVWYQVDVTWDDPSGATTAVSGQEHHSYYCLSDEVMFMDHTHQDVSYDPGCPSMEMNYYIKTDSWQPFGKYMNSGKTVIGYFQSQLDAGNTSSVFSLDDWNYYWPGGNTGYSMYSFPVRYGIYLYGMQQQTWALENGGPLKVNFEMNYSDRVISMNVTGWDLAETGTLELPSSAVIIEENAFEGTKATTVIIPDRCTTLKSGAFSKSGVRTVYATDSLTSIAVDAFDGCQRIIFILDSVNDELAEYAALKGHIVIEP